MKAIMYEQYGGPEVLQLREIPKPNPQAQQVLIKVRATTVTAADCLMRRSNSAMARIILGVFRPRKKYRVLGIEIAGIVEAVGSEVHRFVPGDEIFGFCGFTPGANAEYHCLPETASIEIKPKNFTFEEAVATVDGFTTAMFFLKDRAEIASGHSVLINGASGSIGTAAIQLAKHYGAKVHAVCSSANHDLVRSLGADETIDYRVEDFTLRTNQYDIIFDTVSKSSFARARRALKPKGKYIRTISQPQHYLASWATKLAGGKRLIVGMSVEKRANLAILKELCEADKVHAVIDREISLEDIPEAHEYVEAGHKRGNIVVRI